MIVYLKVQHHLILDITWIIHQIQFMRDYHQLNNITGNKIHLHNSRFFNLGVYDNFYKGLLFEDITAGTTKRIYSL